MYARNLITFGCRLAVALLAVGVVSSCSEGDKIERRGSLVAEFAFPASRVQRHLYIEQAAAIGLDDSLIATHDENTEFAYRKKGDADPIFFYLAKKNNSEQILVVYITKDNDSQGLIVQEYAGALSSTELSRLDKKLRKIIPIAKYTPSIHS